MKVDTTTDYHKFKLVVGNREIDRRHVEALKDSIQKYPHLSQFMPVMVNDDFQVFDGQHRLQAYKELKLEVPYVIVNGLDITDIHVINTNKKNWKMDDFARSYAALGKQSYKEIVRVMDEYSLTALQAFYFFKHADSQGVRDSFKAGNFTTDLTFDDVWPKLLQMQELRAIYPSIVNTRVLPAWLKISYNPQYDQARMVEQLRKRFDKIGDYSKVTDNMRQLEDVYNYNREHKVRLF